MSSGDIMGKNLKESFAELRAQREVEALNHESSQSWELAYISYWSILEEGLKLFASPAMKLRLHSIIKQWDDYLSGKRKELPKQIRNFSIEYKANSIPSIEIIRYALGEMPTLAKFIEPKQKWRVRRNEIAHRASKFKNEALFKEYKAATLAAIDELNKKIDMYI